MPNTEYHINKTQGEEHSVPCVQCAGRTTHKVLASVDVRGEDVSGLTVNIAARIMGVAEAGETLVSDAVCSATLGSGLNFGDARTTQLKGIPEPFTVRRWVQ
jgi:class 3 adenylate cyclase